MTKRRKITAALAATAIAAMFLLRASATPDASKRLIPMGAKRGPAVRDINLPQLPTSDAIVIGKDGYVVDAGYGTTMRLVEKKIPLACGGDWA